ncbi:hypothetical protein TGAM01_v208210 [Trichoderma gamsii]|uniref:Uncharacterized protein n=1 Tax=Trichoderma gamsii TaxID=398673 RepID=A0A2P4ZF79_9HYPO|nr:hypothetical protein TGAM01_v208210 [Trichoderma gamsii]PON22955.1 hypothetical protein TGAM01_v208210 [Trichoderma gamsii]
MSAISTAATIFTSSTSSRRTTQTTPTDLAMASPSPPSSKEADLYYWGLPSRPKLVARSSTHVWEDPFWSPSPSMMHKSLRPADGNPLLHRLWNDATSSLRNQIVEAVDAADWTAVDILRLGCAGEFHTTLLVSVKPASLSWSQAHPITLRCKAILEGHGIDNVHCEIRESIVTPCGNVLSRSKSAAVADTTSGLQLSSASRTRLRADRVDMSDCLGTRISMKDDDTRFGTKGIYLSVKPSDRQKGEQPKIVALACGHVVAPQKSRSLTTRLQGSQTPREAIQIDQPEYDSRLARLESSARQDRNHATESRNCGDTESAVAYDQIADDEEDLVRKMKPYVASSSRVFGTLLSAPKLVYSRALRDTPGYDPWLRDWALIELLPRRHQISLDTLRNKVFVGPPNHLRSIVHDNSAGWRGLERINVPAALNGTLALAKTAVPMSELYQPAPDASDDEPTMLVAQYGAGGKLTVGLGNSLKSLVRRNEALDGDVENYGEEWAVTSFAGTDHLQAAFSLKGDSGSCVWDIHTQRPAAIIMAGVHSPAQNGGNDVTYAQPLERLLGDIGQYGFDVSLV